MNERAPRWTSERLRLAIAVWKLHKERPNLSSAKIAARLREDDPLRWAGIMEDAVKLIFRDLRREKNEGRDLERLFQKELDAASVLPPPPPPAPGDLAAPLRRLLERRQDDPMAALIAALKQREGKGS